MNKEEITISNKTARSGGAVGANALLPKIIRSKYPLDEQHENFTILDFGAGPKAMHTKSLRGDGYICHAYDMGANYDPKVHISDDLMRGIEFDVIMVSNVINTLSSLDSIKETLDKIYALAYNGSEVILNYPKSPRKCDLFSEGMLHVFLANRFEIICADDLSKKGVFYCRDKRDRLVC